MKPARKAPKGPRRIDAADLGKPAMMRSSVTRHANFRRLLRGTALVAVGLFTISAAAAQDSCGLCDKEIITNSDLATCFLEEYQRLAAESDGAIVVDLSECPQSRGVVEPLPSPNIVPEEPDVKFMVSRAQLACLKQKLEEPGLVLDPSAKIDLDSCG